MGVLTLKNISIDKESEGRTVLYEEIAPSDNLFQWSIVLGGFVLVVFYFFAFFFSFVRKTDGPESMLFILLLYCFIMWDFFSMKFRITNSGVEVALLPFRYSIPFSDIEDVKTSGNLPWYYGWGIRMWGRKLAFISRHDRSVVITRKTGYFRNVILTAEYPGGFLRRITREMG